MALRVLTRITEEVPSKSLGGPPVWQVHDKLLDLVTSREKQLSDSDAEEAYNIIMKQLVKSFYNERFSSIRQLQKNIPNSFKPVFERIRKEIIKK